MLGVVTGLGVSGGAAPRARWLGLVALVLALVAALFVIAAALPFWLGAAALVAATALGALAARPLAAAAVPAAVLAVAVLAFVPGLGYVEAVAAPVVAWRLRRRGAGRYAGLRTLARD